MRARAEAAARTADGILDAVHALWLERSLDEITLADVAKRAGVTVQTVLRRFASKDGLIAASLEREAGRMRSERDSAPPHDVGGALDTLLEHYERDGDAVVRTLALEATLPAAAAIVATGRRAHRDWCARVFARHLPTPDHDAYEPRLDAFVLATDVYLWKVLRRDLDRSPRQTKTVLQTLLDGLTATEEDS